MAKPYPDHPQLRGNFAPLRMECDIDDVVVRGEIPSDLNISYFRNGPDPQFAPRGQHHWFGGDGMVHGFHIQNGKVRYRNRWARTQKWQLERDAGKSLFSAFNPMDCDPSVAGMQTDGTANTNIVWHGNKLMALEEGHAPFELDPNTLESKGGWNFDGGYGDRMTAHPKIDPKTGEMLFFGYMVGEPLGNGMSYQVVDKHGQLTRSDHFEAPIASMVHDFITTDEHVIFPIFPLTGSLDRAMTGGPAFAWEPDKGSHIGVLRRGDSIDKIRWYAIDPCYVFHALNACTRGDKIIAHMMQFEEAPLFPHADGSRGDPKKANARLCEWTIDLAPGGGISRRYLDDITGEFPRLDERFTGLENRHGYYAASTTNDGGKGFDAIAHVDLLLDRRSLFELPSGDTTGEPIFVPKSLTAAEGEGYLLSVVSRAGENRSDLLVFDATDIAAGPLAAAELPHRVPHGFHGNWKYND
ncbi:MAG: carotenoid cleavage dioxygenase-like enzyme [Paraglaciecola psychrophila]|jgi:carotenoid cleavage dioxygenase-like enzyme